MIQSQLSDQPHYPLHIYGAFPAVDRLVQDGVLQLLLHSVTPRVLHAVLQPRGAEATLANRCGERNLEYL
jgi:hypothetical protein